jgi:hypothetical protein
MASAPCRRPVVSPATVSSTNSPQPQLTLTLGQIAQALDELIALGSIEKFKDEFNVIRYRPTNGRVV